MALIPQALGLEAKDRGVSESAWIVQIAGTIIFQKLIHSWKITIMRSVLTLTTNEDLSKRYMPLFTYFTPNVN